MRKGPPEEGIWVRQGQRKAVNGDKRPCSSLVLRADLTTARKTVLIYWRNRDKPAISAQVGFLRCISIRLKSSDDTDFFAG